MMIEWKSFLLGDVIEYANGSSFPNRFQGLKQKRYDFYKVSDMNNPKNFMYMVEAENTVDDEIVEKLKAKVHPKDTVIFPKVGAALLTNKRRILSKPSLFDNNIMGIKPKKELLPLYLYYFMLTIDFAKYVQSGAVPSINKTIIDNIPINLPSLPEQRKIADILSSVDEAIEKTEAIIEQTEKVKKGLMQQLLTKGIGHTRFKKTKIGEIPEEWEVKSLKEMLDDKYILDHMDGNHGELYPRSDEFTNEGIPYVSANCIKNQKLELSNAKFLPYERAIQFKKGVAQNQDVLFAHNATVGPVAVLETDYEFVILSTTLTYYRCNQDKVNPYYLSYYMQSQRFIRQYVRVMGQTTRNQVPITLQRSFIHIIPPIKEQKKIVEIISPIEKKLNNEINKLTILKTIKKSLMQSLLTGKVRVKVNEGEVVSS